MISLGRGRRRVGVEDEPGLTSTDPAGAAVVDEEPA
jgi:hypothetical protein